jgi:hypothetical protein
MDPAEASLFFSQQAARWILHMQQVKRTESISIMR